jgi:phosphoglycolate phosphatase-like HAD superfamily hydrolase
MDDSQAPLRKLEPRHEFLVAVDSDGCAFDSMEIKHKECFIPAIIKHWDLQPVSKYARSAAEFVNLYSTWRGINRFPALVRVFDLLREWPDVLSRRVEIPVAQPLRDWIERETKLANPTLRRAVEATGDPVLRRALEWSEDVNSRVADMVRGVPPFPFVRETLAKVADWADIIVCSATPGEALRREWTEHGLADFTRVIAGQEMGTKKEHLQLAISDRYDPGYVLMVGDAPGDRKAAEANHARFFPINPGAEERSWERFFERTADDFRRGSYGEVEQARLIEEFESRLPRHPPWMAQP